MKYSVWIFLNVQNLPILICSTQWKKYIKKWTKKMFCLRNLPQSTGLKADQLFHLTQNNEHYRKVFDIIVVNKTLGKRWFRLSLILPSLESCYKYLNITLFKARRGFSLNLIKNYYKTFMIINYHYIKYENDH